MTLRILAYVIGLMELPFTEIEKLCAKGNQEFDFERTASSEIGGVYLTSV